MKFDAVVGNPPYQIETDNNRDTPTYHFFMDEAYHLSDKVILITPARYLFNAGQTPKAWNNKMLNDKHLKVLFYEKMSNKVFTNTDIKGGIAVTYRDKSQNFEPIGVFSTYEELDSILTLVTSNDFVSLSKIHHGNSSYKLTDNVYSDFPELSDRVSSAERKALGSNVFERFPELFLIEEDNETEYVKILGRIDNKRIVKSIKKEYISEHPNLYKWKVFVTGANGTGTLGETLSSPLVEGPSVGGTQTFISFGAFNAKIEAENCLKYLKTKFLRLLLGVKKVTQNNKTKDVWSKIPLQNFTEKSDIDWSKSISAIDKQLYEKYKLSNEEIAFIEDKVQPMN
jgi:hypothetical protein